MTLGIILGTQIHMFPGIDSIADGFVMLLQMTALPYIALSLMVGIGSLSPDKARATVKTSLLILLILTLVSLLLVLLTTIAFPNWHNASFYSASTIKTEVEFDLIALFIPSNPFNAFANAVIPSVVVFSIFVGIGLMKVKAKHHTLSVLANLQTALANISAIVMRFAPIGVFCIGYRAAATIDVSQIEGLIVYVLGAIILVLLLALVVFPVIVATVTPFKYRHILVVCREAMITAFATGSFFAVIPLIVEKTKETLASLPASNKDTEKVPGIIVPITFSLPVGGKLLGLLFVLFSAWFSGAYIGSQEYFKLFFLGIPQLFSSTTVAMPALLELFNVSSSMFELFLVAENIIVGRLGALLSVSFTISFVLLIAASITKSLTIKPAYVKRNSVILPILSVALFYILHLSLSHLGLQYKGYDKFIERSLLFEQVKHKNLTSPAQHLASNYSSLDVLTRIKQRGFIRVGYFIDDLPYAFHNNKGELVGFDIEIIHMLASDLNVEIEFVRILHAQAEPMLGSGYLDMTSGVPVIPDNMQRFTLTIPYSEQTVGFLVKNNRRAEFTHWQEIISRSDLTIGVPETFFYKDEIQRHFVNGRAWEISTPRLFFREEYQHIDAMLFGAAAASGWSLLYPNYTVVVPTPKQPPINMAFPINENDQAFELFMRNWLEMKKQSGKLEQLFNYWIQGQTPNSVSNR